MWQAEEMRWAPYRRATAALLAVAALACVALGSRVWHSVWEWRINPDLVFGAFYTGPDYHVSPADRSWMLDHGFPRELRPCTGFEHLGAATFCCWGLVIALAAALALARWRRALSPLKCATVLVTLAALGLGEEAGFLQHLLDRVAQRQPAQEAFADLQIVVAILVAALAAFSLAERQSLRIHARDGLHDAVTNASNAP